MSVSRVYSYASIVDQKIQSRLLPHESLCTFLHACQALKIHFKYLEVEWLCAGCLHLLYGLLDFVRGAAGDVDSSAMESEL